MVGQTDVRRHRDAMALTLGCSYSPFNSYRSLDAMRPLQAVWCVASELRCQCRVYASRTEVRLLAFTPSTYRSLETFGFEIANTLCSRLFES